jgi:biopolymer transport protein TolR
MAAYKQRQRRKPMGEINVVPYIDVMLVLLIIFMITAPMLTQGVQVDLPTAQANQIEATEENSEPLVVSIDAQGLFYISVGNEEEPIELAEIEPKVAAVLERSPNTPVLVRGDNAVDYGRVVSLMALLQQAGAESVGLITKQPESESN